MSFPVAEYSGNFGRGCLKGVIIWCIRLRRKEQIAVGFRAYHSYMDNDVI